MSLNPIDAAIKYPFLRDFMVPIVIGSRSIFVDAARILDVCRQFWNPILYPEDHGFDRPEMIEYILDEDEDEISVINALRILHVAPRLDDAPGDPIPTSASVACILIKWLYPHKNILVVAGNTCQLYTHPQGHTVCYYFDPKDHFLKDMNMYIFMGINEHLITSQQHRDIVTLITENKVDPALLSYLKENVRDKGLLDYIEKNCMCYNIISHQDSLYDIRLKYKDTYLLLYRCHYCRRAQLNTGIGYSSLLFVDTPIEEIESILGDEVLERFLHADHGYNVYASYFKRKGSTIKLTGNTINNVVVAYHLGMDLSYYRDNIHELYKYHDQGEKYRYAISLLE